MELRDLARLTLAVALFAAVPLIAQEAGRPPPSEAWKALLEVRTTFVGGSDLDDADGELDTWINETKLRLEGSAWTGGRLGFSVGHEHRRYDFDDGQPFIPALNDPWRDVHTLNLGVQLLQGLSRDWAMFFAANAKASAAVDADLEDGISGLFLGGVGYRVSDDLRIGVGVVALAPFEDDFRVFPAVQFDWKISDDWRMKLEGLRFDLSYRPEPEWSFGVGAEIDGSRFRLADTPSRGHGIIEDKRLAAFLRVAWTPDDSFELALEGGLDLWRQIDIADRNGDNGDTFKTEPAPFVSLALRWSF